MAAADAVLQLAAFVEQVVLVAQGAELAGQFRALPLVNGVGPVADLAVLLVQQLPAFGLELLGVQVPVPAFAAALGPAPGAGRQGLLLGLGQGPVLDREDLGGGSVFLLEVGLFAALAAQLGVSALAMPAGQFLVIQGLAAGIEFQENAGGKTQ